MTDDEIEKAKSLFADVLRAVRARARAEAIEEAAQLVEQMASMGDLDSPDGSAIASNIRDLWDSTP